VFRTLILAALIAAALLATDLRERTGRAFYHAGFPGAASTLLGGGAWAAAALYEDGRYAEAAQAFRAEDFSGQHYDVGLSLARAGRLRDAADAFDYALVVDPNDEDARFNLALIEALMRKAREDGPASQGAANAAATENKRSNTTSDSESDVNSAGEGAAGDRDSGQRAENAGPSRTLRQGSGGPSDRANEPGKASGSIGSGAGAGRTGDAFQNVARPPEQLAHRLAPMALKTMAASQRWLETLPDDPGVYLKRRIAHEQDGRKERGVAAPKMTDAW
jgi:Ca-activated chloride channel family protein